MGSHDMRKMSLEYVANALLGTWAKTAKGEYTRSTGEVIVKTNSGWLANNGFGSGVYCGLSHAMWAVDGKYRS